jgi:hypothetical protein
MSDIIHITLCRFINCSLRAAWLLYMLFSQQWNCLRMCPAAWGSAGKWPVSEDELCNRVGRQKSTRKADKDCKRTHLVRIKYQSWNDGLRQSSADTITGGKWIDDLSLEMQKPCRAKLSSTLWRLWHSRGEMGSRDRRVFGSFPAKQSSNTTMVARDPITNTVKCYKTTPKLSYDLFTWIIVQTCLHSHRHILIYTHIIYTHIYIHINTHTHI